MSHEKETAGPWQGSRPNARRGQSSEPRQTVTVEGPRASADGASRVRPGASGVILSYPAKSVGAASRQWHRFEERRREKLAGVRAKWVARAATLARNGQYARALYAHNRGETLGRDLLPSVDRCGTRTRGMRCGCKAGGRAPLARIMPGVKVGRSVPSGWRAAPRATVRTSAVRGAPTSAPTAVEFTCRQFLVCEECCRRRSRKLKAKMATALMFWMDTLRDEWRRRGCPSGMRPNIVLMTLSVRHSGDVAQDRAAIQRGWRAFYKSLHERDRRDPRGWVGPYVGVWEVTPGRDGLGHVHMHVAIIWPRLDWRSTVKDGRAKRGVRQMWLDACPESEYIDFKPGRKDGKASTGYSAAKYLSKYISKGVNLSTMGEDLAADVVASSYNQHSVLCGSGRSEEHPDTGRRRAVPFWQAWHRPHCACCGVLPWVDVPFYARTPDERRAADAEQRSRSISVLAMRYGPAAAAWLARAAGVAELSELAELSTPDDPHALTRRRDRGARVVMDLRVMEYAEGDRALAHAEQFAPPAQLALP